MRQPVVAADRSVGRTNGRVVVHVRPRVTQAAAECSRVVRRGSAIHEKETHAVGPVVAAAAGVAEISDRFENYLQSGACRKRRAGVNDAACLAEPVREAQCTLPRRVRGLSGGGGGAAQKSVGSTDLDLAAV